MDNMDLSHHPGRRVHGGCRPAIAVSDHRIPETGRPSEEYLDLEQAPSRELEIWKRTLFRFVQQVYCRRKTVILKNPTA